jgi:hypothetical protein
MEQVEQLDPFYFKFKGRIARLLGRESVSNSIVALCEFVKNSWDADATEVKIIFENPESEKGKIQIIDNGSGLSLQKFDNTWMTVATDDKEKNPLTQKYKRPKVGEKGIGRFATEKLAHSVDIVSKPEIENYGFNVNINWDEYEKGGQFDKIPNPISRFSKKKKDHGFEIILSNLRERWNASRIDEFQRTLGIVLLPVKYLPHFKIRVFVGNSPRHFPKLQNRFLSLALYRFKSTLNLDGTVNFRFSERTGRSNKSDYSMVHFRCGSADFDLYFFYRDKRGSYPENISIKNIKNTLDRFSALHLYRDNFKVNLLGDWAGLDKLRVNDPSNYPGYNQIIGFVKISKNSSPEIIDTTTREGIVENEAWGDLKKFIYKSIDFFVENRKRIEKKALHVRKKKVPTVETRIETEELLTFSNAYPGVFYRPLEKEINACYSTKLFNACLLLSRKMIENLIFNLLDYKFPRNIELRWNTGKNRPHDFSVLIDNLEQNKTQFNQEEQTYIYKLLERCKTFRRYANSKAHNIMEYVEQKNEIDSIKIPEMVQILLNLIMKIRNHEL